jgi:hypothetical protein
MKTFDELKEEYQSKKYSLKEIRTAIFLFSLAKILFSDIMFFIVSSLPYVLGFVFLGYQFGFSLFLLIFYIVCHFLFWTFFAKNEYTKMVLPIYSEADMIIKILKELKSKKDWK